MGLLLETVRSFFRGRITARSTDGSVQKARPRRAVFTIVSSNYIAYAATLMQSAAYHMPEVERFIVLSDTPRDFTTVDLCAKLLDCDQINIDFIDNMKIWYTVIEFNTAIKPYVFLHLLSTLQFDECCYIDPDILLFRGLTEAFDALADHSVVLTPHMLHPLQDGKEPSDLAIMKSGVYNLGFLGLRNDQDGCRLARWWADRCFTSCRVDIPANMFTDQRWMDLAPAFVARPFILRHPGYNVAYWNLLHRKVERTSDDEWIVNSEPLVFFHFSGITPDKPDQFSRHQNRFEIDDLGAVREIFDKYRDLVLSNQWFEYSQIPYGFGRFPDGRRIDDFMRHWIIRSIDEGRIDPRGKLNIASDYFDQVDDVIAERGPIVTRYMYQFWLDRKDLRAAFDIFRPEGLAAYCHWFTTGEAASSGVDERSIAAARSLRRVPWGQPPPIVHQPLALPWPSVSCQTWFDSSAGAIAGLGADIELQSAGTAVLMPNQIALLWERRRDLQTAFDLSTPERLQDYLAWAVFNGIRDGVVDPDLLSARFVEKLTSVSVISAYYGDVPVTDGMILLRRVEERRDFVPNWRRFPTERTGRLAHGLWFAFIAPQICRWPAAFTASVRSHFQEPTSIRTDDFALSRGALAIWELRPDLQRTFPLSDRLSVWTFLRWLLVDGLRELGLGIDEFDPRLREFLLSETPRYPGISQLLEMIHGYRPDLGESFELASEGDRCVFLAWAEGNLAAATDSLSLGEALRETAPADLPAATVRRVAVALTGYWNAPSGRGEDVRGSAQALDAMGYSDYVVIDIESKCIIAASGEILPQGTKIEAEVNIVHTNADTAVDDANVLRILCVRSQKAIGFWAWELEWLPNYWRHAYSFYDEIWAATQFAERAFSKDKLRPVRFMPMVVSEPEWRRDLSRAEFGLPSGATVFLFIFDYRSFSTRKNPEAVIAAFLSAFPEGDEPVYLFIKTSGASERPADQRRLKELATDGRIELRDARLERTEVVDLIRVSSAFVSLHRSEGFGRGPAEAMLLGVPTILTAYSGTADYAAVDTALLVDFELVPVAEADYPGVAGQRWADANIQTAAAHMRWIHDNPASARELGRRGGDRIRRMYNPCSVGHAMLDALGLRPPFEVSGHADATLKHAV